DTVTPVPSTATVAPSMKFVPASATSVEVPRNANAGATLASDGADGGSAVTVNGLAPVVPPAVVTVTLRAPGLASASTLNAAVMDVALVTVTLSTVTQVPVTATVAPSLNLVPVSVTATVDPCTPLAGDRLVNVGAPGRTVMSSVKVASPAAVLGIRPTARALTGAALTVTCTSFNAATGPVRMSNVADVVPAGTVTVAGTMTSASLLTMKSRTPPEGAA